MKRDLIPLWLLIVVAFAVITIYSCVDPIKVGNVELKSSGIADRLTRARNEEEAHDGIKNQKVTADAAAELKVSPDTASQSILIIGDSMLEGLNPALAAYARHNGHRLNSVIWYSSTSEYWGNSDTLRVFLERFKPTFIFISLGANELFVSDIAQKRDKYVKSLLRQVGDIPYLWIGPPNWKDDTGINDLIASNVAPGCYFKTKGMTFEREKDGAHPTRAAAKIWMDSIARWMPSHSSHPIRMEPPTDPSKARPDRVVALQPLK